MSHLARRSLTLAALACLLLAMGPKFPKGEVRRIPGWSSGLEPNAATAHLDLSASGRWAVFDSNATNLLEDDDSRYDIYVYDARKDVTIPAALAEDGGAPELGATRPAISDSGRHVVYDSADSAIVTPDPGFDSDVFLFDVKQGTTELISVDSNGDSVDGHSSQADVNKRGSLVVFQSASTQLVPGDTNNKLDVFLRDRKQGTTRRLSLASDGSQADADCVSPCISANGRYVAFTTRAALVPEDTNGYDDVYVVHVKKGTLVRASVASDGTQGELVPGSNTPAHSGPGIALSASGRYLAFRTFANNLESSSTYVGADILLRDLKKKTTVLVSAGPDDEAQTFGGFSPAISPDGRFVAFMSQFNSPELHIFLRDVKQGTSVRVSGDPEGLVANGSSSEPCLSARAKWIGFQSEATNLLTTGDTNGFTDLFLRRR